MPSFLSDLDPSKRAQFATTARLISCLVTESLVPAFYRPISHADAAGFAFVLTSNSERLPCDWRVIDNFLCIIPLHHPPILKDDEQAPLGKKITLLDPMDMIPLVFTFGTNSGYEVKPYDENICFTDLLQEADESVVSHLLHVFQSSIGLRLRRDVIHRTNDPLTIWCRFANSFDLDQDIQKSIADDLNNAIEWQSALNQNLKGS